MRDRSLCALLAAALVAAGHLKGYGQGVARAERVRTDDGPRPEGAYEPSLTTLGEQMIRSATPADQNRKMQPGDRISFQIAEDKVPATPMLLGPGGEIEVDPLPRAVKISGMTPAAAAAEIKRLLEQDFYYHANVRLTLLSINATANMRVVYLAGAINKTGPLPIPGDRQTTLSQAIITAGGVGKYGDDRRVKVTRKNGEVIQVDVKKIINEQKPEGDIILQPDDKIFVPTKFFTN